MKNIGIVSYNIRCNFTNYGSALQSWALSQTIDRLGKDRFQSILIDYCPNKHLDSNVLNPFKNMWDKDEVSRRMCELSMPSIKENYYKFEDFYNNQFRRSKYNYNYKNFNNVINDEKIDGFVCGADTIFCVDEFGMDDGYYANYNCMKQKSVSYAASFGDPHFDKESFKLLDSNLKNFKALGLRENLMLDYVKDKVNVPVKKVLDPTLLLEDRDYEKIIAPQKEKEKYILLYARRYNKNMEDYAEKLSQELGVKIIEISLRSINSEKHKMAYDAGVEEFLSLVKNAEFVVTNSFHGMIFSVIFSKQFVIFSREQCNNKIDELISFFGLKDRMLIDGTEEFVKDIDYEKVHARIKEERIESLAFLTNELEILVGGK